MENTIFLNADYIVIEYMDLIKSPYLVFLHCIRRNEKLREILKIEQIEFLDDISLYEWYINRKHQNFLVDLNRYPDQISEKDLYDLLELQLNNSPMMYEQATMLLLGERLPIMQAKKMAVKDIIIYHPHENNFAKDDLTRETNHEFTFMNNFEEVLDKAKSNSTYFLSDIEKVITMKDKEYLKCSSVTLPVEYRYNKKNMNDFKYDLYSLYKDIPYKLSFFRACTFGEELEELNDEDISSENNYE